MKSTLIIQGSLVIIAIHGIAMEKPIKQSTELQKIVELEKKKAFADYEGFNKFKPTRKILLAQIGTELPAFLGYVPINLRQPIADFAEYKFGPAFIERLQQLEGTKDGLKFIWAGLGLHFGLSPYYNPGQDYFYFTETAKKPKLFKARRYAIHLPSYQKAEASYDDILKNKTLIANDPEALKRYESQVYDLKRQKEIMANDLVKQYKIHLMPAGDLTPIIIHLLSETSKDNELQELVHAFKVRPGDYIKNNQIMARIVIYPASGKEKTQKLLNKLYVLLKGFKGLDQRPRYNAKVTDLIWIAQGDADEKKDQLSRYYEPDRVYYRNDITGNVENYNLVHPETGKEII